MSEEEIKNAWSLLLAKHVKGSVDAGFNQFRYSILVEKAEPQLIAEKWKEYLDMCKKEERQSKYIKDTHNWLTEKGWLNDYKTKDMKTRSFIERWLADLKYIFT
jgi:hypothetical protein